MSTFVKGGSLMTFCGANTIDSRISFRIRQPCSSFEKKRRMRSAETSARTFGG
jgi:hypothetical protein